MIKGKNILIISRQKWGNMFLSKHNYALELSQNNQVFFLESPDHTYNGKISLKNCDDSENIKIVKNGKDNTYRFRFLGKLTLKWAIHKKVKKILTQINHKIDIVISFDDFGFYPYLNQFKATHYVYFPVDAPSSPLAKEINYPSKYLFSISKEVAEKYSFLNKEVIILNHGLSKFWQNIAELNLQSEYAPNKPLKFGFIGNLLKGKIQDTDTLMDVIKQLNSVEFHFWGPFEANQNNVGGNKNAETSNWIAFLKNQKNVFLHGVLHPKKLTVEANKMDGYFICKNDKFDHNKSSNSHKIMEYLSTGKIVVSSYLSSYSAYENFIAMPSNPSNDSYLKIFKDVVDGISFYNNRSLIESRINFVLEHTYSKNLDVIFQTLNIEH